MCIHARCWSSSSSERAPLWPESQDEAGEDIVEACFSCSLRVGFLVALAVELNLRSYGGVPNRPLPPPISHTPLTQFILYPSFKYLIYVYLCG